MSDERQERCDGRPGGFIVVEVAGSTTIWRGASFALLLLSGIGCTSIDPGSNFVVPQEVFDANYYFCHVEPNFIVAKKCGPGEASDNGSCHYSSSVSGMALLPHPAIDCGGGDQPLDMTQTAGAAESDFEQVSLEMSHDYTIGAPLRAAEQRAQPPPRRLQPNRSRGEPAPEHMGVQVKSATGLVRAIFAVAAILGSTPARAAGDAGGAGAPTKIASIAPDEVEPEAFARVVVDAAELRTGPGVSYRVLYDAHRGETFALDGRPGAGFWLRVLLPDGRDRVRARRRGAAVRGEPGEEGAPSRPGLFAPPPLEGSRGGLALLGGVLSIPVAGGGVQRFGYIEARPSLVLHKTVSLEGFIGDGLTSDGAQLLYGGGVAIYLAPSWPVCPFVGLFAGGLSVLPASDSFVLKREDLYVARAGGGFLFALRNRILVRIEATNLSVFSADSYKNAQTYAGGLGVYF